MKSAKLPLQQAIFARLQPVIEAEFAASNVLVSVNPEEDTTDTYVVIGQDSERGMSAWQCPGSWIEHTIRVVSLNQPLAKEIDSRIMELLADQDNDLSLGSSIYIITWELRDSQTIHYERERDKKRVYEVVSTYGGETGRK